MTTSSSESAEPLTPFFILWTGQAVSLLGSQLVQFALIWWLTQETGSATVLAIASLVGLLPRVVLGPFIGALVDRWNRKHIMLVADSLIALVTIVLAFLFLSGDVRIWQIYMIMFLRSVGEGFHGPAMTASTSLMVPKKHLTRIQGLNQTLNGGLNIVAAPLGAILLDLMPIEGILGIDVVTALFAIVPLFFIFIPQPEPSLALVGKLSTVWQDVRVGFRYMMGWTGLMIIAMMAVVINLLFTPAFSLLPLLVKEHFGGGAIQLGAIESTFGIGVVLGGLLLGAWGGFKRRIFTSMLGLIGAGLGVLMLGLLPASLFSIASGALFIVGMMLPVANGPILAVLQATVKPEMQGRVLTLLSSASSAMSPVGLSIAGPVADAVGVRVWYVTGGVVCMLMAVISFFIPAVIHIEDGRTESLGGESGEGQTDTGLAVTRPPG
jgi:DHA3 family macrolide efflux protein-like MFS transporter